MDPEERFGNVGLSIEQFLLFFSFLFSFCLSIPLSLALQVSRILDQSSSIVSLELKVLSLSRFLRTIGAR